MIRRSLLSLLSISMVTIVTADSAMGQEVLFTKRSTQPLDTSHQVIECNLNAERTIRQQNQLVDSSKQTMQRKQDRTLTILAIEGGKPTRAKLQYLDSSTNVRGENNQSVEATQPVAGNTYFVSKQNGTLTVTDEAGQPVTEEENKILQMHLQTFGKTNPLAQFLDGKRIQVGDEILVPDAVASELLGLTGNEGKTDKLTLRLVTTKKAGGQKIAVFETLLKSSSKESSMSLVMKGELAIETSTCRTRSIRLHGPVAISETRGPTVGRFVVSTNGTLQVAVQTTFGQAQVASKPKLFR